MSFMGNPLSIPRAVVRLERLARSHFPETLVVRLVTICGECVSPEYSMVEERRPPESRRVRGEMTSGGQNSTPTVVIKPSVVDR